MGRGLGFGGFGILQTTGAICGGSRGLEKGLEGSKHVERGRFGASRTPHFGVGFGFCFELFLDAMW